MGGGDDYTLSTLGKGFLFLFFWDNFFLQVQRLVQTITHNVFVSFYTLFGTMWWAWQRHKQASTSSSLYI